MFFNQPITLHREQPGTYVDGIWQPGKPTQITVQTSVQPIHPDDMLLLPEGRRDQKAYALYTKAPINAERNGANADRVEIYGETYECVATQEWQNGLIPHYRSIVVLERSDNA